MGQAADQWWLWRGFQSAVFYYASCGPCYAAAYQRKRRKEAGETRRQKEQLQMEQPDLYHHPAPFEINPHWQEEIRLGPGPPPRRARKGTRDSSDKRTITTAGTQSTLGSHASSSIDLGPQQHAHSLHLAGHSWNKKRYHRPDEEFVEVSDEEEADVKDKAMVRTGSSVGISGWTISKPKATYHSARAPAVNELHPPVVSTPPSAWKDRAWMKAPPPSAKFMQGKKGVTNLSRNGSKVTVRADGSTADVTLAPSPLLRPQSGNVRSNTLELPDCTVSRKTSSRLSKREERMDSLTASQSTPIKSSLDEPLRGRRKSRPPPVRVDSGTDDSDWSDYFTPISKPKPAYRRATRTKRTGRASRASAATISPPQLDVDDTENVSPSTTVLVSPALTARSEHTAETVSPIISPAIHPLSNSDLLTLPQTRPRAESNGSSLKVLESTTGGNMTQTKSLRISKYDTSPSADAKKQPLPESDSKEVLALQGEVNIEHLWLGEQKFSFTGADRNKRWSVPDF